MIRPMKWHIYQKETNYPCVWDDKAIDFDTKEEAERFAIKYLEEEEFYIKEDILYYDGNYISAKEIIDE